MKKTIFLFGMLLLAAIVSFPLSAKELKRGDWMIGIGGGPEGSTYSYTAWYGRYFDRTYFLEDHIQDFTYFSRSLHVEYAARNDFSLALRYSEAEASKLVMEFYGPPNEQGWLQGFENTVDMTLKEIGLNGSYHLGFLRVRRLDPMLTAGIKGGWRNVVLPLLIEPFFSKQPGDWIIGVEHPNCRFRYFSTWLAVGCRYWLLYKLAVGCHYQLDFLLSQKNTTDMYLSWTNSSSLVTGNKSRAKVYFEIVARL